MLKQSKFAFIGYALLLGLGLALLPQASFAADDDILVTDPDTLEAMGFDRDAENVYMAPDVELQGALGDRLSAVDLQAQTKLFASGSTDYSPVSAKEFIGRIDTTGTQWRYRGGPNCCLDLSRVGTERFADAQVTDLPNGGTLTFLRWWIHDAVAQDAAVFLFEACQPGFAAGPITFTTLVSTTTSGAGGNQSQAVSTASRPINTRDCTYVVRVRFDAASTSLALQKVRLQFTHP